jgi:hypothetical protein
VDVRSIAQERGHTVHVSQYGGLISIGDSRCVEALVRTARQSGPIRSLLKRHLRQPESGVPVRVHTVTCGEKGGRCYPPSHNLLADALHSWADSPMRILSKIASALQ